MASVIQVFEIYRVMRRDFSEEHGIEAVAALRTATIVEVDEALALDAATISFDHHLAMADALIYATAQRHNAALITSDADFEGLPQVTLIT